ncbi:hypothetical protein E3N88_23156 [Mikania micrantha]|uniref:NAD(P)H oxidase (H(2)O(2)-forming) n=1 Tax=Mikania micrantha TaxID=192012 RepID=A0A5N6NF44_9ASTR|nr:hypothetical protein E3N88_23156 [Mikania micrantha]
MPEEHLKDIHSLKHVHSYIPIVKWSFDALHKVFTLIQVNGGIKVLDLVQLMVLDDPFVFDLDKLPLDNPDNGSDGRVEAKWVKTRAQIDWMQTQNMGSDDVHVISGPHSEGGPLNKRGGWTSVRLNVMERAPGGSNDNVVTIDGHQAVNRESKNGLSKIRQVSKTLKYLSAFSKQPATHGLKFVSKNDTSPSARKALDKRFDELKNTDGLLPRSRFGECIGMNKDSKAFAEDLFNSLCQRRNITSDSINKQQFNEFWDEITNQNFDSRLQIFLDMVDEDKDGRITEDEVTEMIKVSASANKLSNITIHARKYAALIMEELDPQQHGYIMIDKLENLLRDAEKHKKREEQQRKAESSKQQQSTQSVIRKRHEDLKYFLHDNWRRCWVIILWTGIMVGLFIWKYIQYKNRAVYDVLGACVCIAKGAAETLKLNMAIMLLPVCRNTITWLRNKTKLGVIVSFDDNISFHQMIAVAIAIGVGLHAISHLACDFPRLIHATEEEYRPMQHFFGDQAKNYWHFVKEVEGYTGIIMVVLMTIAFTFAWLRQGKLRPPSFVKKLTKYDAFKNSKLYGAFVTKLTGCYAILNNLTGFNVFWYTHHLFIIVYAMLIVHGIKLYLTKEWYKKTTWMYLVVPIMLYACERLIRSFRSRSDPARILKVTAYPATSPYPRYPGGVLALRVTKPKNFKYKSGEYMFVKCAAVSPFEWHPFSITSAPGDDYLSVHIRALGDWTEKINKIYSDICMCTYIHKLILHILFDSIPKVKIDGPYGAPAQDYKNYEVVLLVGLGIGATPMISIVKDIVNNIKSNKEKDNSLEDGVTLQKNRMSSKTSANDFKTKQAYLYWVTKEQESFDWFEDVMNEVAGYGVIEVHNYCTSVYEEGDARSALITMLQAINHAKNGVDVVSGTRVKTHFARPNWSNVYDRIAANHRGSEIGVFYCGTPVAMKELKKLATDFSQDTSKSIKFVFHKENF